MKMFLDDENKRVVERLRALNLSLCKNCLGRLFGKVGRGLDNVQRAALVMSEHGYECVEPDNCALCGGIFGKLDFYAKSAVETMNAVEWNSFLVGSKFEEEVLAKEERIWMSTSAQHAEAIKSEFNREVGKKISQLTGKDVDFDEPDCVAIVDTRFDTINLEIRPLFIYGRYKKYVRGIPQTRWLCRNCMGKGCKRCNGKGKMYETSVQELIAEKVMLATQGKEHFFHGMGREDIDVRMLGNGRPFILEIREPVIRTIDLKKLENEINDFAAGKVSVEKLRIVSGKKVEEIKEEKCRKRYSATVEIAGTCTKEMLEKSINDLREKDIYQETPNRVLHRRSDIRRVRHIYDVLLNWVDGNTAGLEIECEAGTYVKELISGDGGRTRPSLTEILGIPCRVKELDVIWIHDEHTEE